MGRYEQTPEREMQHRAEQDASLGHVIDPLSYGMLEQEVRRLSKLLALLLAAGGRTDERTAFAATHAQMREPLNAELWVQDRDGVTSAWLEQRRDPDLVYTPPSVDGAS